MLNTLPAVVRKGKIELLDRIDLCEGQKALVMFLPDEEARFWLRASQASLDAVWKNDADDIYAQLLEK